MVIDDQVHGQMTPERGVKLVEDIITKEKRNERSSLAHHGPAAGNGSKTLRRVMVCAGTGCVANGAYQVVQAFADQIKAAGINVTTEFKPEDTQHDLRLNQSGCQGFCQMGPLVTILPDDILYNKVKVGGRGRNRQPDAGGAARWSNGCSTWIRRPKSTAGAWTKFRSTSASNGLC